MKTIDMDEICRRMSLDEIPWNIEEPPQALVELVATGVVQPRKAIDPGYGTGNCCPQNSINLLLGPYV